MLIKEFERGKGTKGSLRKGSDLIGPPFFSSSARLKRQLEGGLAMFEDTGGEMEVAKRKSYGRHFLGLQIGIGDVSKISGRRNRGVWL